MRDNFTGTTVCSRFERQLETVEKTGVLFSDAYRRDANRQLLTSALSIPIPARF